MKLHTVLLVFLKCCEFVKLEPVVEIPGLGYVEGIARKTFQGKRFYSFEGVPYAEPPIGKNRFEDPKPIRPWNGILKANTIYKCLQKFQYISQEEESIIGDEDCLYLNIYTPTLDKNSNLNVLVYIHGGAFMFFYGGFQQPDYILDKNLIYVSLNYRLGPLGFLSTEDEVVPGNYGLKDQILALQWIKDNIRDFGGNPDSVTIMGMSAGGASVHFHFLCPKSQNLFQRGISQSGTLLNPWAIVKKPLEKAQILSRSIGCPTSTNKEMASCLKSRSGRQIVQAIKNLQPWLYNPFSPFGPVIDSWSSDPVLPEHPLELIKKGKLTHKPWLCSYVSSEGLYPGTDFYYEQYLQDLNSRWNDLLPFILHFNDTVESNEKSIISTIIREEYLKGKELTKENFMDFIQILSDRLFINDIERTIKNQAKATTSSIFMYVFKYRGKHSKSEGRTGTTANFGAAHGDDTSYILKTTLDTTSTEDDRLMVETMTEIVASFVKSGKLSLVPKWLPISKTDSSLHHLEINAPTNLVLKDHTLYNKSKFWDNLPINENDRLFSINKDEL